MAELYQGKFSGEEIDSAIEKIEAIQGLPTGGTTGQVVTKTDGGAEWANAPSGLPAGGTTGQVVTKTDDGAEWANVPSSLPTGGTVGQVLTKTEDGVAWVNTRVVTNLGRASSCSDTTLISSYFPKIKIIDDYQTKIRTIIVNPP